jgi:hypothetical protein
MLSTNTVDSELVLQNDKSSVGYDYAADLFTLTAAQSSCRNQGE